MGKIVAKLDLNKNPQNVEPNSLIYAKNIRLGRDGNLYPDFPFKNVSDAVIKCLIEENLVTTVYNQTSQKWIAIGKSKVIGAIVGINNTIYLFIEATKNVINKLVTNYVIIEYNETTNSARRIRCSWTYAGGSIDGYVSTNHTGEIILTVCEKLSSSNTKVPMKHINLSQCNDNDDESLYTQAPNIPITNLFLVDTYPKTIPNGVYQFFIRYEIRKNFYTNWFPCSKECFAGNSTKQDTVQGSVKFVNTHRDSDTSFIFNIEHINSEYLKNYKRFQLGFILSHEDEVVARSWKHFDINDNNDIYFDYDKSFIEEIDVTDLLYDTYELYNVGNIDYFKNKLYISNYLESDKNPVKCTVNGVEKSISDVVKGINISLHQQELDNGKVYFDGKELSGLIDDVYTKWGGSKISSLFNTLKYNTRTYTEDGRDTKADKNVYNIFGVMHYGVDPDVYWLQATYTPNNADVSPFPYLPSQEYNWDYRYSGVLISNYDVFEHQGIVNVSGVHVLANRIPFTNDNWFARSGYGYGSGVCADNGMSNIPLDDIKQNVKTLINNYAPKTQITKITITLGSGTDTIVVYDAGAQDSKYDFKGTVIDKENIDSYVLNAVSSYIFGIRADNYNNLTYIVRHNNSYKELNKINVYLNDYEYNVTPETDESEDYYSVRYECYAKKTVSVRHYIVSVDDSYTSSSIEKNVQYRTLMPFTKYKFFIHYIDKKGLITNGYEIDNKILNDFNSEYAKSLIYPVFEDIIIPDEYEGCFISINKPNETVCESFGGEFVKSSGDSSIGTLKINCLEADALLYPLAKNIKLITTQGSAISDNRLGTYYPSGVASEGNFDSFGNGGYIGLDGIDGSSFLIDRYNLVSIESVNTAASYAYAPGNNVKYLDIYLHVENSESVYRDLHYKIDNGTLTNDFENFNGGINFSIDWTNYNNDSKIFNTNIFISDTAYITTPNNSIKKFYGYIICLGYNNTYRICFIYVDGGSTESYKFYYSGDYRTNKDDAIAYANSHYNVFTRTAQSGDIVPIDDHYIWIKISNNNANTDNNLVKLTPFISKNYLNDNDGCYDNYETLNSPAFICTVYKPAIEQNYYISGTDAYRKSFDGNTLKLEEELGAVSMVSTRKYNIYSTFNLNYLSMSEDFVPNIRRYSTTSQGTNAEKQIISALNSLTLSDCYKLESMYYEYTKKLFFTVDYNTVIEFNNTIRSSKAIADEVFNNIYEFLAEDYYNVPANRGKIINLVAVANNIYVHTEHALYRFTGSNSLVGNESDVVTKETDVFDSGITEIFDSEVGYAGLQHKNESIVTFNSYIFYDRLANAIYAYEGQNSISNISLSINKLLDYLLAKSDNELTVRFASDYKADRIFINFYYSKKETEINSNNKVDKDTQVVVDIPDAGTVIGKYEESLTKDGNVSFDDSMPENGSVGPAADELGDDPAMNNRYNVCLSYDLKTKSFISIHDFDFEGSISTRSNTYFTRNISTASAIENLASFTKEEIPNTNPKQYQIGKILIVSNGYIFEKINHNSYINSASYVVNELDNNDYDKFYKKSLLSCDDENAPTHTNYKRGVSCIDVICNINYEQVKCINYINWICSKVLNLGTKNTPEYINADNINFAEENIGEDNERYPGNFLRIYSDTCHTDIIDINNIQNNEHYYKDAKERTGLNPNSYKYVRYNKGIWAYDYFRDIKNSNSSTKSDDMSLIYGKYFVVRFVFYNKNYKFENVKINMNNYD